MVRPATIRLAPTMRNVLIGWFTALALFVVILGVAALSHGSPPGAIVAAAVVGLLVLVGWRWAGLAVTAGHDQLVVRQFLSTQVIPRSRVASFRVGGRRSETPGIAVWADLTDGSRLILAATGFYFRSRNDVETCCTALEEWRQQQPPPPVLAV